jgi:hypothetical protein
MGDAMSTISAWPTLLCVCVSRVMNTCWCMYSSTYISYHRLR